MRITSSFSLPCITDYNLIQFLTLVFTSLPLSPLLCRSQYLSSSCFHFTFLLVNSSFTLNLRQQDDSAGEASSNLEDRATPDGVTEVVSQSESLATTETAGAYEHYTRLELSQ